LFESSFTGLGIHSIMGEIVCNHNRIFFIK